VVWFSGSQAWEWKISSKGNMVLLTKGGSLLSLWIKMDIVALADFAATTYLRRENNQEIREMVYGWTSFAIVFSCRSSRVLKRIQNFDQNGSNYRWKTENNFSREESEARLSQAIMLLKALTWLETNTEVNYLLISFLYHWFHGFHVFSGVIINIIFSMC
jgi:hypothetical protein